MSRESKKKHQSQKREPLPELSQEEFEALEREIDDEMFGPEDAKYFRLAGINNIGNQ